MRWFWGGALWIAGCSLFVDGSAYVRSSSMDAGPPIGESSCDAACTGDLPVCESSRGMCVACSEEDDSSCSGATPVCDLETFECVSCLIDDHCEEPTPRCDPTARTCVQCVDEDHCGGATPLCDVDAGSCVGCLDHGDCIDPQAAKCGSDGFCGPCDDNEQCAGVTDGEIALGVCSSGACVQCTLDDASACGTNPCTFGQICSNYGIYQSACDPCDTDANCEGGDHFCIPMVYQADAYPDEDDDGVADHGFCLERNTGSNCMEPFSRNAFGRISLSGVAGQEYCSIGEAITTCESVRALLDNRPCSTGMDSECPGPTALCRTVGALPNRCTFPCTGLSECPTTLACNDAGSGGPDHCN